MMHSDPKDSTPFDLLDAYQQAESPQERARLRQANPELAGEFKALDDLKHFAVQATCGDVDLDAPTLPPTPTAPATVEAPTWPRPFGPYELLEEIGHGGMGIVFRARHKALGRQVAIKMLLGQHLVTPDQLARFHAEARASTRVNHPHIVPVYEAGQIDGLCFIAMQYVEGRSLESRLRSGLIDEHEAVCIVAAMARAVSTLHAQGIIHRDLKPANVLIDPAGHPYLSDFGLAKFINDSEGRTATGVIVGTPGYMAPEQAAARKDVGSAADVYSLGAILYELLTGRPPFQEATALDTLVQVLESEPPLPRRLNPRVARELELVCLKCLDKLPEQRYPSAQALAEDLDRFLSGEALHIQPPNVGLRILRWSRREPALALRWAALLVAGLIVESRYLLVATSFQFHALVIGLLALWAVLTPACRFLLSERWMPYVWVASDATLLSLLLHLTDNQVSPLVAIYPLVIVLSGLGIRQRVVWFATALTALEYLVLVALAPSEAEIDAHPHLHVIFLVLLLIFGSVVVHQVDRTRILNRYFGSKARTQSSAPEPT